MGFSRLDYAIVILYLAGVTVAGSLIAGRQENSRDYFLGGKQMSWWSVGFSIVASETSTLTFISIPGLAFRADMHFLQLVFGYFVGRILVCLFFIPAYYRGDLETAYDFLGRRFGLPLRKFTSSVFIVTRLLASAVQQLLSLGTSYLEYRRGVRQRPHCSDPAFQSEKASRAFRRDAFSFIRRKSVHFFAHHHVWSSLPLRGGLRPGGTP